MPTSYSYWGEVSVFPEDLYAVENTVEPEVIHKVISLLL